MRHGIRFSAELNKRLQLGAAGTLNVTCDPAFISDPARSDNVIIMHFASNVIAIRYNVL